MNPPEFIGWPKTPRLYRDMVITEKIDGSNAGIIVTPEGDVWAQSRNRLLYPPCDDYPKGTDNAGFRAWVDTNREFIRATLGVGRHFGEWWGHGINRGYNQTRKRFSLFNVAKWQGLDEYSDADLIGLGVVPVLFEGRFSTDIVRTQIDALTVFGSAAAPGFMRPEGVCVYHTAAGQIFKVLIDNDEVSKSQAAVNESLNRRAA